VIDFIYFLDLSIFGFMVCWVGCDDNYDDKNETYDKIVKLSNLGIRENEKIRKEK